MKNLRSGRARRTHGGGVARVPVDGEALAVRRFEDGVVLGRDVGRDLVGRKTRLAVGADGVALGLVSLRLLEVLRVGRAVNVEAVAWEYTEQSVVLS